MVINKLFAKFENPEMIPLWSHETDINIKLQ